MRCCLLALFLPVCAGAAVHGVPEPLRPGPLPLAWMTFENDFFADRVLNADDFRTGGGNAGGILPLDGKQASWFLVGSYDFAALTRRDGPADERSRADEQSAAVGLMHTWAGAGWQARLSGGPGGRWSGNYKGEYIQNGIHSGITDQPLDLAYEPRARRFHAWAGGSFSYRIFTGRSTAALFGPGDVDLRMLSSAMAAPGGSLPWDVAAQAVGTGQGGLWWMGGRFQGIDRHTLSQAAAATARHEAGWWVDAGTTVLTSETGWSLTYAAAINPRSGATTGFLTADLSLPIGDDGQRPQVRQAFLYGLGTRGGGVQLVAPASLLTSGDGWAMDAAFEYRWGNAENYHLRGCEVQVDQFGTGVELRAASRPQSLVHADVETQVLLGCRIERVAAIAADAAYAEDLAVRPMIQPSLRAHLGTDGATGCWSWLNRLRPGAGIRWMVPWFDAETPSADGSGRAKHQLPRIGYDLELAFLSRW